MPEKYTYLLVDFWCIIFPFLFSFHPRLMFFRQWRFFVLPCLFTALCFLAWDGLFTAMGVWSFNPAYVCGIYIGNMPLEELLFFICIPYACVFSYYCFTVLFRFGGSDRAYRLFYLVLAVSLAIIALFNLPQLYTSVTGLLLAIFLVYLYVRRATFLKAFFWCFLFILVPFILSNGVLTGSFAGRVVVRYNPDFNLGIRILTIPVEDTFYGMLLLLLNVYGFELRKRNYTLRSLPVNDKRSG